MNATPTLIERLQEWRGQIEQNRDCLVKQSRTLTPESVMTTKDRRVCRHNRQIETLNEVIAIVVASKEKP